MLQRAQSPMCWTIILHGKCRRAPKHLFLGSTGCFHSSSPPWGAAAQVTPCCGSCDQSKLPSVHSQARPLTEAHSDQARHRSPCVAAPAATLGGPTRAEAGAAPPLATARTRRRAARRPALAAARCFARRPGGRPAASAAPSPAHLHPLTQSVSKSVSQSVSQSVSLPSCLGRSVCGPVPAKPVRRAGRRPSQPRNSLTILLSTSLTTSEPPIR